MKIGIIGAGHVGTSLGKALLKAGHEVMFSSREPDSPKAQQIRTETGAPVDSIQDVINFSNLIAIAMPPDAALQVAQEYKGHWADKTIIDMNNRFGASASGRSFAQDLAEAAGTDVVKAFNMIGAESYQNPIFGGQPASMLIAGDDPATKKQVLQIASDIGFDAVDAGNLEASALIEKLAQLWVHLMRSGAGRDMAFKLIRR